MTRGITSAIPIDASEFACLDFINTAFTDPLNRGVAYDRLVRKEWWAWFLQRYELDVRDRRSVPLRRSVTFRGQLRSMLEGWATTGSVSERDAARLDRHVRKPQLRRRVSRRPELELAMEPVTPDWNWVVGAIAASAVELISRETATRLKVCTNTSCTWMFYDQTLNASKRFCSTDLCGKVVRVRRFRGRTAEA